MEVPVLHLYWRSRNQYGDIIMAYGLVNDIVRCDDCKHADWKGCNCKFGLMFPVMVFMTQSTCPNFDKKTREQIIEQLKMKANERGTENRVHG